jgi:endonuclease III
MHTMSPETNPFGAANEKHKTDLDQDSWQDRMASWASTRTGAGRASDQLAAGLTRLVEINRHLEDEYGTPNLGNKTDPVDELVYIILSRRTRESAYQSGFVALKARFGSWDEVVPTRVEALEAVIRPTGLARKKAASIKQALSILSERFGSCTLDPTSSWPDDELAEFLCSLPEVGPKSAACVMMWSLGRPAFPVDTHVGRVLERVGIWSELGLSLSGTGHKTKQAVLADLVPPAIRLPLHVNALVHGRLVCRSLRPLCQECRIASLCDSAANGARERDRTGRLTG